MMIMITITTTIAIIKMPLLILKNTMIVNQLVLILTLIKQILKKLKREYRIKKNDVRISLHATQRKHLVELLIIRDGENKHFFTISNISRLLPGSKHDRGMHYGKICYCSFRIIETLNVFVHIIIIFIQRWRNFNNNAWSRQKWYS